jgi:3-hydroxybutyryl-CoA dehydrogenase
MVHLGVVGCGVMGRGIAQVAIQHGLRTTVADRDLDQLQQGWNTISASLSSQVQRGKIRQEEAEAAITRLRISDQLKALSNCDIIIEAIVEELAAKLAVLKTLDGLCPASTILASNTSSIVISELAKATSRPDRFVGLHFFNPPTALPLLELIHTPQTSRDTLDAVIKLCTQLERVVVRAQDTPGFVVNRLLVPFIFDAIRLAEAGVATVHDIDVACKAGLGHAMGPLATADLGGLDTLLSIGESLYASLADERYKPPALLQSMVKERKLGRKMGVGFFTYS